MSCIVKEELKPITMEEVILHQNEELSCPKQSDLEDFRGWPR